MLVSVLLILLAQNFSYPSSPKVYHFRKLPQISCLLWQKFCHDKHMFVAKNTNLLSQQNYVLSWQNIFVTANTCLSWQKFCHNKHTFVVTKDVFGATSFVTTKICLLWQAYFCHNKRHVCCDKNYTCGMQLLPMLQVRMVSDNLGLYRQGLSHTPSITFWHLPPNSARFSYATKGALFISTQLCSNMVSALQKVRVLACM